jgi:hypothetical protein
MMATRLISFIILIIFTGLSFGQTETKRIIYFTSNRASLDDEATQNLDSLVQGLKSYADFKISLTGHTDDIGSNQFNDSLSGQRVISVRNYLIAKGIAEFRIKFDAFGKRKPIVSNNSDKNRGQNRRVEVVLSELQLANKITETVKSELVIDTVKSTIITQENGVIIDYGKFGVKSINVKLIRNTEEMEARNITTMTTGGNVLASNIIFCVERISNYTDCILKEPITIYIPTSSNPFCRSADVKFYDADSTSGSIRWKDITPDFSIETREGIEYFVISIRDICVPCKNFDCPYLNVLEATVKLKPRKYRLNNVQVIYKSANALLEGSEINKRLWSIQLLDKFDKTETTVKIKYSNKRNKEFMFEDLLSNMTQDSKGNIIVKKKDLKKK